MFEKKRMYHELEIVSRRQTFLLLRHHQSCLELSQLLAALVEETTTERMSESSYLRQGF